VPAHQLGVRVPIAPLGEHNQLVGWSVHHPGFRLTAPGGAAGASGPP
jgi:hypothetical protein